MELKITIEVKGAREAKEELKKVKKEMSKVAKDVKKDSGLLKKSLDLVRQGFKDLGPEVKKVRSVIRRLDPVWEKAKNAISKFGDGVKNAWSNIKDMGSNIAKPIKSFVSKIRSGFSGALSWISEKTSGIRRVIGGIGKVVVGAAGTVVGGIGKIAKTVGSKLAGAISGVSSKIGGMVSEIGSAFSDIVPVIGPAIGAIVKTISMITFGLGGAAAAAAGFGAAIALTTGADLEQLQIGFTTLLGNADAARKALDRIKKDAKSTPFEFVGLAKTNQMLISTGLSADRSADLILALGDSLSAVGRGNVELQNMAVNLQQIKNVGHATAIDFKQFQLAGIDLTGMLADSMGKTREEIGAMDKSLITFEEIEKAFLGASQEGGRFFNAMENQSKSLRGIFERLKESIQLSSAEFLESSGLYDVFKDTVSAIADGVDAFFEGLLSKAPDVKMALDDLKDALVSLAEQLGITSEGGKSIAATFGELIGTAIEKTINFFEGFVEGISEHAPEIKEALDNLSAAFGLTSQKAGETEMSAKDAGKQFGDSAGGGIASIIQGLADLVEVLKDNKAEIKDAIRALVFFGAQIMGTLVFIGKLISWGAKAADFFKNLPSSISKWWTNLKTTAAEKWEDLKQAVSDKVTETVDAITTFFQELPSKIKDWFQRSVENAVYWIGYMAEYIPTKIEEIWNSIVEWFTSLPGKISEWLENTRTSADNKMTETKQTLSQRVSEIITKIVDWFKQLPGRVVDAIKNLPQNIKNKFWEAFHKVREWKDHAWSKFKEWGRNLGKAFVDGVGEWLSTLKSKFVQGQRDAESVAKGSSPPKEGPWKNIDKWGENIGVAWSEGVERGMGMLSMPSPKVMMSGPGMGAGPIGGSGSIGKSDLIRLFKMMSSQGGSVNNNFNAPISFGGRAEPMQQESQFANLLIRAAR